MKNVGILNFWWVPNYGALLTAYALQNVLKNLGHSSILIDNSSKFDHLACDNFAVNFSTNYLDKTKMISKFSDYININDNFPVMITGSDQILRPIATGERLFQYLQGFVDVTSKKITFAASFAVDKKRFLMETDVNVIKKMKILMQSFDFVSVREKSGVDICKDLFDVDAEWIIDPVFILNKDIYSNLMTNSTKDYSDRIVSYVLDTNKDYDKAYKYLNTKYGKKIEKIAYSNILVENWLQAIKSCKFLITDSYHGMCFAIIFNKPFICISNQKRGATRFESVLDMLDIENQCIESINAIYKKDCIFKINYEMVNQKIEEEAQKGLNFLKKAIDYPVDRKEEKYKAKVQFLENEIYELEKQATLKYQIKKELWNSWRIVYYKYLPKTIQKIIKFVRNI